MILNHLIMEIASKYGLRQLNTIQYFLELSLSSTVT